MRSRLGTESTAWTSALGLLAVKATPRGAGSLWGGIVAVKKGLAAAVLACLVGALLWVSVTGAGSSPTDARSGTHGDAVTQGGASSPEHKARTTRRSHKQMREAIRGALARDDALEALGETLSTPEDLADALEQAAIPRGLGELLGPLTATIESGLAACMEDLAGDHGGELHFTVELMGAPDVGTILDSVQSQSTHPAKELVVCAEAALRTTQFPPPRHTLMRQMVITMNLDNERVQLGLPVNAETVLPLLLRYPELARGSENVASLVEFEGVRRALLGALDSDPAALASYPELQAALERASQSPSHDAPAE